jgi:hypothetical protein
MNEPRMPALLEPMQGRSPDGRPSSFYETTKSPGRFSGAFTLSRRSAEDKKGRTPGGSPALTVLTWKQKHEEESDPSRPLFGKSFAREHTFNKKENYSAG